MRARLLPMGYAPLTVRPARSGKAGRESSTRPASPAGRPIRAAGSVRRVAVVSSGAGPDPDLTRAIPTLASPEASCPPVPSSSSRRMPPRANRSPTILTGAGYTVTRTAEPDEAFAKAAEHQLVIIDVADGPEVGGRDLPRDPGDADADRGPGHVRQRQRRRRGADRLPRGRRRRRRGAPARRPRARGPRRGAAAPIPALAGPDPDHLVRRADRCTAPAGPSRSTAPRAASGRRPSPRTSRSRRSPGGPTGSSWSTSRSSSAASRPCSTSTRSRRSPTSSATRPRMREPELLRTYAMRHDSGLHVLAAPGAPESAEAVTPTHVAQILTTLLDGYDMIVIDAGSIARRADPADLRGGRGRDPAGHAGDRGAQGRPRTCSST